MKTKIEQFLFIELVKQSRNKLRLLSNNKEVCIQLIKNIKLN